MGYVRLAICAPSAASHLIAVRKWLVIPKHFLPPMLVNGLLGFVLWSTYTEASSTLEPYLAPHPTTLAAISGATAGGAQALLAAPAENMRFALEGTSRATGWSDAWKEVFRRTEPSSDLPRQERLLEARQVRDWMKEVGEMAGRGWEGWGWGCAKDICGKPAPARSFNPRSVRRVRALMPAHVMQVSRCSSPSSMSRAGARSRRRRSPKSF